MTLVVSPGEPGLNIVKTITQKKLSIRPGCHHLCEKKLAHEMSQPLGRYNDRPSAKIATLCL